MPSFIDRTGQRFDRLVVKSGADLPGSNTSWLCVCDCGNTVAVKSHALVTGNTRSCGCVRSETTTAKNRKHGHAPRDRDSGTAYASWHAMRDRCANPNATVWQYYGGRGITVCERWQSFENFLADMGERPPGTSLDRFPDNNGNYEPGNVRWATPTQQSHNSRRTALTEQLVLEVHGRYEHGEPCGSIARRLGLSPRQVSRIRSGATFGALR